MPYTLTTVASMREVDVCAWDRLVHPDEPFTGHAYLHALESTGCVGVPGSGWHPAHMLLHDEQQELVAAMPLYIKTDSYGEFIFDWAWADAAMRAGIPYYPKLVGAIPFTPATGRRIMRRAEVCLADVTPLFVQGLDALQQRVGASGVHLLFCQHDEAEAFATAGFIPRVSSQFHWQRAAHWRTFDDFVTDMRASCRKQLRRERARAQSHGLTLSMRPIQEVSEADCQAMYSFYRQTIWEKGAQAYLTEEFFMQLHHQGQDRAYVAMAHNQDVPVAGALFFRAGNHLYGRYWGAAAHYDALHFELCYYLPIDWCLTHGIVRFEAGAQGEHKLKRGFLPNTCHSAHRLQHPGLHAAVVDFCAQEGKVMHEHMATWADHGPFHRSAKNC